MKKQSLFKKAIYTSFVLVALIAITTSYTLVSNHMKLRNEENSGYNKEYNDAQWAKARMKPVVPDKIKGN
ncbi:hypothetical protein KPL47_10725 [Clostridium estertheticum]|uniref:hypothetical protein n=1 Tax=Clostridium estertheticum TaxID=238834 RepID=UPI001C0AEB28|nr:hypothetical protein [Clostridium estertheticum]MBU3176844.1 hypothetical protein [Clostridium estertheticum]